MDFWLQKSEFNALQLVTNSEERDLETKVHTLKRLHGYRVVLKYNLSLRIGEPGWAETSRLFLKSLFFLLFLYLIFMLTSQVLDSPTIDQISYEKNPYSTVDIPGKVLQFCYITLCEYLTRSYRCQVLF